MIAAGELPALAALLARGSWTAVTSPTGFSAGAVWPSFSTGLPACDHGQYSIWNWDPATMQLAYTGETRPTPFWKQLSETGTTVGVLDVPFAPFVGLETGFEVIEWGAHSSIDGHVSVAPRAVAELVERFPAHPFADPLATVPYEPADVPGFLDSCIRGLRLRGDVAERLIVERQPDLSLVVFEEAHHAGHFLWHTVEPDLPLYADVPAVARPRTTLLDLYREMDRQVGRLVEAAGPDATVLVFALHGMGPARGLPPVLEPVLAGLGMASVLEGVNRHAVRDAVKRHMPSVLRDLYRRSVPLARRSQWGKSGILPPYDWSRTKAFALPYEQYGNIRINLAGREAEGVVPAEEYDETCASIEQALRALRTMDDRPVVADVVRPPRGSSAAGLPDLVAHWHPAVFESPACVNGVEVPNIRREQTGQHAWAGFCIESGPAAAADPLTGEDVQQRILAAIRR
jgi:predicted AlkP superfamily phosphohydrolase/phosphomutase